MNKNNNTLTTCAYIGTGSGCTAQSLPGSSYCQEHHALVYKLGSGRQRRKDTRQADRVRLVETLFQEAVELLILEGFDVYGDSELAPTVEVQEFDDR
jgi:hypothetical protein